MESHTGIRIGTLVKGTMGAPEYIRQILPHGFESFTLTFWQTTEGIDWPRLADEVASVLDGSGAVISCLDMLGNPLENGPLVRETLEGWKQCIDNAHRFDCTVVGGFTGRVRGKPIHESIEAFKRVWGDLAKRASVNGLRIAFENCHMGGTWASGDWNIAHNPTAWEMMFDAVPSEGWSIGDCGSALVNVLTTPLVAPVATGALRGRPQTPVGQRRSCRPAPARRLCREGCASTSHGRRLPFV